METKRFEVTTGYGVRKVVSGPYATQSLASMVAGLEQGQRIKLTKITEAVYENERGQRYTIVEVA